MTVYNGKYFKSWLSTKGKEVYFTDYLYDLIAHTGAAIAANPGKRKLKLNFTLPDLSGNYSYTVELGKTNSIIL